LDLALLSRSSLDPLDLDAIIHFRISIAAKLPDLTFDRVLVGQCSPVLQCEILRNQPIFSFDKDWEALEKSRLLRTAWDAIALARPHEQALLHSLKHEEKQ